MIKKKRLECNGSRNFDRQLRFDMWDQWAAHHIHLCKHSSNLSVSELKPYRPCAQTAVTDGSYVSQRKSKNREWGNLIWYNFHAFARRMDLCAFTTNRGAVVMRNYLNNMWSIIPCGKCKNSFGTLISRDDIVKMYMYPNTVGKPDAFYMFSQVLHAEVTYKINRGMISESIRENDGHFDEVLENATKESIGDMQRRSCQLRSSNEYADDQRVWRNMTRFKYKFSINEESFHRYELAHREIPRVQKPTFNRTKLPRQ